MTCEVLSLGGRQTNKLVLVVFVSCSQIPHKQNRVKFQRARQTTIELPVKFHCTRYYQRMHRDEVPPLSKSSFTTLANSPLSFSGLTRNHTGRISVCFIQSNVSPYTGTGSPSHKKTWQRENFVCLDSKWIVYLRNSERFIQLGERKVPHL